MDDVVIKFENVSKLYRLGLVSTKSLSHDINRWWKTFVLKEEDPYLKIGETNDRTKKGSSEYVWALRDISFDVKQGEVWGIIGKNGAGKSTLLKILSRVTTPTKGIIKAKGRIASLLEVGTGFHHELTGRDNIYLNGSIMGMTRAEISRKLDEIVDFAGVERYLDTPTKRYSSGMTVRLGFSVAAHLEPEILVVDEVLAVGDAEFQKKAIGKLQDVSKGQGRTVLFVSHNLASVKAICHKGILLKEGLISYSGPIDETINQYKEENYSEKLRVYYEDIPQAPGNDNIHLKLFEVTPIEGNELNVESGINFRLQFYNHRPGIMLDVSFKLSTASDITVFYSGKILTPENDSKEGIYEVTFSLPPFLLNAGRYNMMLVFGENQHYILWSCDNVLGFSVDNTLTGQGYNMTILPGVIKPLIDYKHRYLG